MIWIAFIVVFVAGLYIGARYHAPVSKFFAAIVAAAMAVMAGSQSAWEFVSGLFG